MGHLPNVCRVDAHKVSSERVETRKAIFSRVAALNSVHKWMKKLWLDHMEWSKEVGLRKTAPAHMPKMALDISVLKAEHKLLYPDTDILHQKVGMAGYTVHRGSG